MNEIEFYKYSGSGNDFIIVDNRSSEFDELKTVEQIRKLCHRQMGIGADGIIFLELPLPTSEIDDVDSMGNLIQVNSYKTDIRWDFYNNDGSKAEMCGNGARCTFHFYSHFIQTDDDIEDLIENGDFLTLDTIAGIYLGRLIDTNNVQVLFPIPEAQSVIHDIKVGDKVITGELINTGVPHFVVDTEKNGLGGIEDVDVNGIGRVLRYSNVFERGSNVNFVAVTDKNRLRVRTYERGVEAETLACGTGIVASTFIFNKNGLVENEVTIIASSKRELKVTLEKERLIYEGEVDLVYRGTFAIS